MKGTIVSAWVNTCKELYGEEITKESLAYFGINQDKIFSPSEDIDDKVALGILEYIGNKLNKSSDEIWRTMGKQNIQTYSKVYPAFFRYKNLYSFLEAMYDIHLIVTQRVKGANPPILRIQTIDKHTAHMTYESQRGMFSYFIGMLEGAADYFGEDIDIKTLEKTEDFLKLALTFPEEISYEKKFILNKALSLGFIKSMEAKLALASLVFVGVPSVLLIKFAPSDKIIPGILGISAIIPFIVSKGLFRPLKYIYRYLDKFKEKDFSLVHNLSTNDFFESLNDKLGEIKDSIKTDFVGYKGTTDELNVFADKFSEISSEMSLTSDDIYSVVEQVAEGALNQAYETEQVSSQIHDSIDSLSRVVEKENQGKNELEASVATITRGFEELKTTSNSLNNVLEQFSQVQDKGKDLQYKANQVRDIVATVEKIAGQTNLLALNASIEASRVGEEGKGFAVIASEIRDLAEGSKDAVQTINSNLESFIENIDEFVLDISGQFTILENENRKLNTVAEENTSTVNSIKNVSKLIIELTSDLTKEANNINRISETIESLAAIAQENSASAQEVSANIQTYTEEIRKMTENIDEFKKVSMEFSKDLEKYTI